MKQLLGTPTSLYDARYLQISNNLSDVANANTSLNNLLPDQTGNSGKYLTTDGTDTSWAAIDHGATTGLTDDDHSQYFLLAGRSGGQTAIGGTDDGDDLYLQASSGAVNGEIYILDASDTIVAAFDSKGTMRSDRGSDSSNLFIGSGAGGSANLGDGNTGIGFTCLTNLNDGVRNTVIGDSAGRNVTTGDDNMLLGESAGFRINTGNRNTCIGRNSSDKLFDNG